MHREGERERDIERATERERELCHSSKWLWNVCLFMPIHITASFEERRDAQDEKAIKRRYKKDKETTIK